MKITIMLVALYLVSGYGAWTNVNKRYTTEIEFMDKNPDAFDITVMILP